VQVRDAAEGRKRSEQYLLLLEAMNWLVSAGRDAGETPLANGLPVEVAAVLIGDYERIWATWGALGPIYGAAPANATVSLLPRQPPMSPE
jgi:hypothetical protein